MADVKPIIFSGPLVCAILEGRKTQTRRVLKPQPEALDVRLSGVTDGRACFTLCEAGGANFTRYVETGYRPGQIRYVREAFGMWPAENSDRLEDAVIYRADDDDWECRMFDWRPSIHMPRWASRLTLEVMDVRVQRLQEISEEDAKAEGVERAAGIDGRWRDYACEHVNLGWQPSPKESFRTLWNDINAKRGFGWYANPWVVAVTFEPHQMNVDDFLKRRAS